MRVVDSSDEVLGRLDIKGLQLVMSVIHSERSRMLTWKRTYCFSPNSDANARLMYRQSNGCAKPHLNMFLSGTSSKTVRPRSRYMTESAWDV